MKLRMNDNSIFAILLRSPWWVSAGIAAALFTGARVVLPVEYALYSFFVALPFIVIAVYTAWQQFRAPSEAGVARSMEKLQAMSWGDFSAAVEEGFSRDGYAVTPYGRPGADFQLDKAGRATLVACKRWKVARTGIEPLRELDSARESGGAHECIYIATGEFTDSARKFAAEKKVQLAAGAELARLLRI